MESYVGKWSRLPLESVAQLPNAIQAYSDLESELQQHRQDIETLIMAYHAKTPRQAKKEK